MRSRHQAGDAVGFRLGVSAAHVRLSFWGVAPRVGSLDDGFRVQGFFALFFKCFPWMGPLQFEIHMSRIPKCLLSSGLGLRTLPEETEACLRVWDL